LLKISKNGIQAKMSEERITPVIDVIHGQLAILMPIDKLQTVSGKLSESGKSRVLASLTQKAELPNGRIIKFGLNVMEKVG